MCLIQTESLCAGEYLLILSKQVQAISRKSFFDLINLIVPDKPDPAAAKVLQETLGGRFGEMRTLMQFFFQSNNFRGNATQYRDLIRGVFLEEISHVELVQHTINQLLTGAGAEGAGNAGTAGAPMNEAIKHANPHHFIMGAQTG